jgi:hypothetical protein
MLALSACDFGFRPETLVDDLRLLSIRAEPADLAPGETARLKALVVDPSRPGQRNTVLWLGCDPDPFNLNRSACSDFAVLADAGALFSPSPDGGMLPDGVHVIGFGDTAAYAASPDVFRALDAQDQRRLTGTVGQALAFAIAEEVPPTASEEALKALLGRVQRKEVKSVIALFRVRISESPERNHNPSLATLWVGRERWPRGAHVTVLPGEKVELDGDAPDADFEPFTNLTPTGVENKTERILMAWYSTAGRFSEARTAMREGVKTVFTAPGGDDPKDPVPASREGTLFIVLRDTRGGQSWVEVPFYVCDASRPAPKVTQVTWPTNPGEPVVLSGTDLEQVLDVIVDGVALEDGAYSPTNGTWRGFLPAGVEVGVARGGFLTRACGRGTLPAP